MPRTLPECSPLGPVRSCAGFCRPDSEGVSLEDGTPATFGALIGSASDLPTLAGAAAGGLPILGAAGVKALLDRREKLREIRDNQLYFYYKAGERLGTRLG